MERLTGPQGPQRTDPARGEEGNLPRGDDPHVLPRTIRTHGHRRLLSLPERTHPNRGKTRLRRMDRRGMPQGPARPRQSNRRLRRSQCRGTLTTAPDSSGTPLCCPCGAASDFTILAPARLIDLIGRRLRSSGDDSWRLEAVGGEMATRFSGGPTRVRTPETVQSHRVAQSGLPVVGFGLIAKAQPCGCALRRKVQA